MIGFGTLLAVTAFTADTPKLQAAVERAAPPAEVAEAVRTLLAGEAVVVSDGTTPLLTFWFRTGIPARATADQIKNGITYRELPETTVLAAVKLHTPFVDYRKQEIPAGVYTVRIAVQPETGDHMGTAPHGDFGLLIPAASDPSPEAVEAKRLHELSTAATGGDHPAVLLLFPYPKPTAEPKIVTQKDGVQTLNVRRAVVAGDEQADLGFAVSVSGWSKAR